MGLDVGLAEYLGEVVLLAASDVTVQPLQIQAWRDKTLSHCGACDISVAEGSYPLYPFSWYCNGPGNLHEAIQSCRGRKLQIVNQYLFWLVENGAGGHSPGMNLSIRGG